MRPVSLLFTIAMVACFPRKPLDESRQDASEDSADPADEETDADSDSDADADSDSDSDADADADSDSDTGINGDGDGDGYIDVALKGDDCDDDNAEIYPGAKELSDDLDNDCDEYIDEHDVGIGDVIFNEIMADVVGNDPGYEWFELANVSEQHKEIHLDGWQITVHTEGGEYEFFVSPDAELMVLYSQPVVFCEDAALFANVSRSDSVICDYEYGTADNGMEDSVYGPAVDNGTTITNPYGLVSILLDGQVMDEVEYDRDDKWPVYSGYSFQLDPDKKSAHYNDNSRSWCAADEDDVYDTRGDEKELGDRGTPGEANNHCNNSSGKK